MVAGIVSVVVMVQMQKKPTKTATATRATAAPQSRASQSRAPQSRMAESRAAATQPQPAVEAPARPAADTKPVADKPARTVASLQPTPKTQPEPKAAPTAKAISDAERKLSEELWVEQKQLDTDSAKLVAKADGRRRVTAMIAKQYNVPEKVISDLHDQKVSYGEISASLAFSQQLMKRDKSTRQAALDRVRTARKSGQGWAAFAKATGLKIGDALDDVRKTDKQLAKAIG
jgi:hypothetical protein